MRRIQATWLLNRVHACCRCRGIFVFFCCSYRFLRCCSELSCLPPAKALVQFQFHRAVITIYICRIRSLLLNWPSIYSCAVAVYFTLLCHVRRDLTCVVVSDADVLDFVRSLRAFWRSSVELVSFYALLRHYFCAELLVIKDRRIMLVVLFDDEFTGLLNIS